MATGSFGKDLFNIYYLNYSIIVESFLNVS